MIERVREFRRSFASWRSTRLAASVIVATLAVAMAVVLVVAIVVNGAFVRPLPFRDADRLVALTARQPNGQQAFSRLPLATVEFVRANTQTLDAVSAFDERGVTLVAQQRHAVAAAFVDTSFFATVGEPPLLGKTLTAEDVVERRPVIVIGEALWSAAFGRRPDVLGVPVLVDGQRRTVVGVMPSRFRFHERAEAWMPLECPGDAHWGVDGAPCQTSAVAKIKPSVSPEAVQAELAMLSRRASAGDARLLGREVSAQPAVVNRGAAQSMLLVSICFGTTGLLLLVACLNVSNLLIVRAQQRRTGLAIRAALGATRRQLLRQLLMEHAALAFMAAVIAVALTLTGIRVATAAGTLAALPPWVRLDLDANIALFTLLLMLASLLVFGLAPAIAGSRVDGGSLNASAIPGTGIAAGAASGRKLIVAELAIATMTAICVALLFQSYRIVSSMPLGFAADSVVRAQLATTAGAALDSAPVLAALGESALRETGAAGYSVRARYTGYLRSAAGAPPSGEPDQGLYLPADPRRSLSSALWPYPSKWVVSDGYFAVMGLSILRGRGFGPADVEGQEPSAVITNRLARHLYGGGSAVGRELMIGRNRFRVIGIVSDYREIRSGSRGLTADHAPDVFLSERQAQSVGSELLVRAGAMAPPATAARIERIARELPGTRPLGPVSVVADDANAWRRSVVVLDMFFGLVAFGALGLATLGLYAVVSSATARRRVEIGIRAALGARPRDIFAMIFGDGLRLIAAGLGIGVLLAAAASRVLGRMIWGLSSLDPLTYAVASVAIAGIALAALAVPSRRAARVDPLTAVRQ